MAMGQRTSLLVILLLGGLGAACTMQPPLAPGCRPWSGSGDSAEPPPHCFFFPSGLALDPLGDLLYVGNTNADLSFGGGTVVAVDLLRYERAVACFRKANRRPGDPDPAPGLDCGSPDCSSLALTQDTSIETLAGYDRKGTPQDLDRCYCEADLLDSNVVNCESHRFVLRDRTVRTGNFSGPLRLLTGGDPVDWNALSADPYRSLLLPVRGDPSLTHIEIVRQGLSDLASRPPRRPTNPPALSMSCGGAASPDRASSCDDLHRVQHGEHPPFLDPFDPDPGSLLGPQLPPEPFGIMPDSGCKPGYTLCPDGRSRTVRCCDSQGNADDDYRYDYLVLSHLGTGQVSAFNLVGAHHEPHLSRSALLSTGLFPERGSAEGAFGLAPLVPGDLTMPWYLTSRQVGVIATFRLSPTGPLGDPQVVAGARVLVSNAFTSGQDVREMIVEPGGQRAFLTVSNPPSLMVLDTRPTPGGTPANQVSAIVDVCFGPSKMALSRRPQPGGGVRTRIYIACYLAGQVAVVDPDTAELVAIVQAGRGPVSVALNYGGGSSAGRTAVDPCADPLVSDAQAEALGVRCPRQGGLRLRLGDRDLGPRAYVSAYLDNAIAVLDLDPQSPTYHRLVSRIGLPLPKQVQ